ncbi:hypothetical protein BKA70DRAFT_1573903 [Coprinopsis sp. MPI-PUGE-AT-0042]|nr:hypothetical protein BKA70DRAFT_1573903 [Coprinopsis sp. MPI-PUGE-AT-0042]
MVRRLSLPAICERPAPRLASSARSSCHDQLATMVPFPEFPDPPPLHATNISTASRASINPPANPATSSRPSSAGAPTTSPTFGQMKSGERMAYAIRPLSSLLLGTRQATHLPFILSSLEERQRIPHSSRPNRLESSGIDLQASPSRAAPAMYDKKNRSQPSGEYSDSGTTEERRRPTTMHSSGGGGPLSPPTSPAVSSLPCSLRLVMSRLLQNAIL